MSASVRRRYVTNTALYWFPVGLGVAPLVLLLSERGLTPATVAALISAHSFTAAALELPTGGLSDVLGRRGVLAAAGLLMCAAFLLIGLGGTAALLGTGTGLLGAARALSSGPAEAWYVDSVRASQGPSADLRTGLARGATASSVALAVGTVAGGALPWALGGYAGELRTATGGAVVPLSAPMLLAAVCALALTAHSLLALREPPGHRETPGSVPGEPPAPGAHLGDVGGVPGGRPRPRGFPEGFRREPAGAGVENVPGGPPPRRPALGGVLRRRRAHLGRATSDRRRLTLGGVLRDIPATVRDGLRLAVRDGVVRRVMLSAAAAGSALAVVELLTPGRVAAFTGGAESGAVGYAGLATVGFLCSAGGSQAAPLLGGGRRAVVVGTGVVAGALGLLAAGGEPAGVVGYVVFYVTLGVLNPNLNELLHHRVPDDRRATALSVQSLALQLASGTTGLIIGPLATDGALPWLVPLGAVLAVTLLWARPLRKVTSGQPVSPDGQEPRAVDLS
ncbi:MFS transporter [Streptomyces niveiscabiei]|uniref:MFS transporter n=1 Tax=Streptomyces niveiscabiei TaxID=164115 RepID=UPI0029AB798E|nr:MFS transporter [Streptomyces niveiscabiei]MDX3387275.1 MFS transporter [Streptomyces niveiscabiei]